MLPFVIKIFVSSIFEWPNKTGLTVAFILYGMLGREITIGQRPGRVAQSVTCLATDVCLTADPGSRVRSQPGPILSWRLIMK